ncbi:MAG: cyclic nucleotide-binding domain-containing protein [Streptosporangiaceae bacterium]
METMEELLGGHRFFSGLDADTLRLMVSCASNVHFAAGEYLFCEGEAASRFYVLREGRVALEIHSPSRGPVIIDTMDEGDVLGWSWLIPPYRYFGDARAVTPVRATALCRPPETSRLTPLSCTDSSLCASPWRPCSLSCWRMCQPGWDGLGW